MGVRRSPRRVAVAFENPPPQYRPLQIVHSLERLCERAGGDLEKALRGLRDLGLGGLVTNVSFEKYLENERAWAQLVDAVRVARRLGLRVWLYDEEGYPSGAAGGLVLRGHPEYEAQEFVFEPGARERFRVRAAFEGTHAANNYHAVRRYPNLLDGRAVQRFIELTHEAYAERLGPGLLAEVEAFFTDEPSLMACSLGQIPESARGHVPVIDPPDESVRRLPSVPWVEDLPRLYRRRYGEALEGRFGHLFGGETWRSRDVRRRFWALVADLLDRRYFGAVRRWCGRHRVASSGHCLCEEGLVRHPPLNGNLLRLLGQMHIPGIDVLSSDPGPVLRTGWGVLTASFAASAALLNGRRRVMSETSDHAERMAGGRATMVQMLATAAWQYALGVTDFTLYYSPEVHGATAYRRFCDTVGRLGALLADAERVVPVAFYYPIWDAWAHYRPTAEKLTSETQPERLRAIEGSFVGAARALAAAGVPFCLVDGGHVESAQVVDGRLRIGKASFGALVYPDVDELPRNRAIGGPGRKGFRMLHADSPEVLESEAVRSLAPFRVDWDGPGCLVAPFRRKGTRLVLVVNTANEPRAGVCRDGLPRGGTVWRVYAGHREELAASARPFELLLGPLEALVISSRRRWD